MERNNRLETRMTRYDDAFMVNRADDTDDDNGEFRDGHTGIKQKWDKLPNGRVIARNEVP
jgi:hypothetical protein